MEETATHISAPTPDSASDKLKLIEDRLDITPQGLEFCFERKEFLKESFDVDKFIVERKKRLALESLKDDLMAYLRILKSSLVELINQDYADFVNLSTNLVGLDRAITSIQTPMESFQANIEAVNNDIACTVRDIEATLARRQAIRNRKVLVQNARSLACCIDRLESWLGIGHHQLAPADQPSLTNGKTDDEEEGRVLERVGTEYTKLQYFMRKCDQQEKLLRHIRPRMMQVAERLHERLDRYFLAALPTPEEVVASAPSSRSGDDCPTPAWASPTRGHRLRSALRVFVNTDRRDAAMLLLRRHLIEPLLETIELETRLTTESLEKLFDAILLLLPAAILPLRRLMAGGSSGGTSGGSGGPLADLDLVTSALWPAVVERLTDRLPQLFSAGQADVFHANYTASMAMMAEFEAAATTAAFRSHPVTVHFLAKWTLPVYMQLRFQEIASEVEEAAKAVEATAAAEKGVRLRVTEVVLLQLRRCWHPSVFLTPLAHRFWKLSLQLLARYATLVRSSCSADVGMSCQLLLLLDSFALADQSRLVLRDVIEPQLVELGCDTGQCAATFRPAFEEGLQAILEAAEAVEQRLGDRIETDCATHLRLVQDVPRQYRKTNRESPTKPAAYANNLLRPLSSFLELHSAHLQNQPHGPPLSKRLAARCVESIGRRYQESLTEVLESVRKMEDSLRLLRKARGQPTNNTGGPSGSGVSDDTKIRQQLLLDARHIRSVAQELLPTESDLPPVLLEVEALAEKELQQ